MEQDVGKDRRRFGDFETLGASLTLANVDNDRDWRKPGLASRQARALWRGNSFPDGQRFNWAGEDNTALVRVR
ncbi:hypothetical protein G6F46_015761 [Rhizopus delemar]|nr:hypothetical protein G6F46_015761 [Rhizopus delemar]